MNRILLADDDTELCDLLKQYLEAEDFQISMVHDGDAALQQARSGAHDLVILDVMMPGLNGFDVLRELRHESLIPVLMLTARDEDVDSIIGLELGADDYLPKPCNPRVLLARIRAIIRRAQPLETVEIGGSIEVGDLVLQTGSRDVILGGKPVVLTSTEYNVLEVLLREAGHAISKAQLSERALGRELSRYDRSIDMHISSLRKKLGLPSGGEERIKTIRGVGYQYIRH